MVKRPSHTLSPPCATLPQLLREVCLRLGFLGFGERPAPTPSLPSQQLPRWNGPAPKSQLGLSSPDKVKGHQEETLKTNNPPKWLFSKSYTGWRGPEPLVRRGGGRQLEQKRKIKQRSALGGFMGAPSPPSAPTP